MIKINKFPPPGQNIERVKVYSRLKFICDQHFLHNNTVVTYMQLGNSCYRMCSGLSANYRFPLISPAIQTFTLSTLLLTMKCVVKMAVKIFMTINLLFNYILASFMCGEITTFRFHHYYVLHTHTYTVIADRMIMKFQ